VYIMFYGGKVFVDTSVYSSSYSGSVLLWQIMQLQYIGKTVVVTCILHIPFCLCVTLQ